MTRRAIGNVGGVPKRAIEWNRPADDMAAFDALPAELRRLLNYAPVKAAARPIAEAVPRFGVQVTATMCLNGLSQLAPGWRPELPLPPADRTGSNRIEPDETGVYSVPLRRSIRPRRSRS